MQLKLKSAIAAVAMLVGGTAQSAVLYDEFQTGDGEVFLSVFRDNASPLSMIIDTGINANALVANPNAFDGFTVGPGASSNIQTSALADFFGTGVVTDFVFNGGAVMNNLATTTGLDLGPILTRGTAGGNVSDFSGINTVNQNMQAFIKDVNVAIGTSDVLTDIAPLENGYHDQPFVWSSNAGGVVAFSTEGPMNSPLELVWAHFDINDPNLAVVEESLGFWTMDFAAGTATFSTGVSQVPVPAAVWLFGSGLMGLVGAARRRKS